MAQQSQQTRNDTARRSREEQGTHERALSRQNEGRGMRRWDPAFGGITSPFELMDRMTQEMDRWFDRLTGSSGFPRALGLSRTPLAGRRLESWIPRIEAGQKGDQFVVRADLPGLKKEDVDVEVTDEAITIRGERRDEQQEEREGYWRSEREYGQFFRTIPLPEGAIAENANASFRDGVLEITMPCAPSEANRGRRLEIK
jgi:HSP20 family protein